MTKIRALPTFAAIALVSFATADPPRPASQDEGGGGLPMRVRVTFEVAEGKGSEADEVFRVMLAHVGANYGEVRSFTMWKDPEDRTHHLMGECESYQVWRNMRKRLGKDSEWNDLVDRANAACDDDGLIYFLLPVGGSLSRVPGASIRWHRSIRAKFARHPDAYRFARDVCEYVNLHCDDVRMQVYSDDMEEFGTLHWYADYASWGAYERTRARLLEDEGYRELFRRAEGLFVEDSLVEEFHTSHH